MKMKVKMRRVFGIILSLVLALGLMPGMGMTAYADNTETLLTTVSFMDDGSQTHSTDGVVTVTIRASRYDAEYGWLFGSQSGDVTVTPVDGVEITKVRFIQNAKNPLDDDETPFKLSYTDNHYEPSLSGATVATSGGVMRNGFMDGVTSIEVYGYKNIEEYTVTYKVVNGSWSDGTTEAKTETVEEGASPASVPTGMKANSGYTGGSWDTDPSTATISADTTFTYTFVADSSSSGDSSDSGNSGSSDSGSTSGGSSDSGSGSSSGGSSDSGNTSGGTSSGSSDNTNTNTDTSAKVPYEEVAISTGSVTDITGTAAATAESNPFGTKIENSSNLTTLLSITDAEVVQGVNVWLDIQDMSASVPQTDKTLIQNTSGDYTVGLYLDINLFKKVGSNDATKVTETNGKIKASIVIPKKLRKSGRTFEIIRVHNGEATTITGKYTKKTHVFTFETDKFSTYAIAYKDAASSTDSESTDSSSTATTLTTTTTTTASTGSTSTTATAPKTGDANDVRVWYLLLIASLGGLGFLGYSKKKKVND